MTFLEFLKEGVKTGKFRNCPKGDFAKDALRDKRFRDFKELGELETYLSFHGACGEARKAGKILFKKWQEHGQTQN